MQDYLDDDYAMSVLYYSVKKSFVAEGLTINFQNDFNIDGRFMGESFNVTSQVNYKTPKHSLALLLSLRALILNKKYLCLCNDDTLIFRSRATESFKWVAFMTIIMDNWDDGEFNMLYNMLDSAYFDEELSVDDVNKLKDSLVVPEFRNEKVYYRSLAATTNRVEDNVIGCNAFVDSNIVSYVVPQNIVYVGNTVFAYCENLKTIEFQGKVMFGTFPIIECDNLEHIIVPQELVDYYKQTLPYYKAIISTREQIDNHKIEECQESVNVVKEAIPVQGAAIQQPDFCKIKTIFDNKTTTYKYFWFLSMMSLAKEKDLLVIPFKDMVLRMAAMAWPIVLEYGIDLGKTDRLSKILSEVQKSTRLISAASSSVVERHLLQHYQSQGVERILAPLLKNVPYRFLSPWIKYTTDDEVIVESNKRDSTAMYAISDNSIILNEDWWDYISENYGEICNSTMKSFTDYVKQFNDGMKLLKLKTEGFSFIGK